MGPSQTSSDGLECFARGHLQERSQQLSAAGVFGCVSDQSPGPALSQFLFPPVAFQRSMIVGLESCPACTREAGEADQTVWAERAVSEGYDARSAAAVACLWSLWHWASGADHCSRPARVVQEVRSVSLRKLWTMAKETAKDWLDDEAATLAAALAYYALLSLAPLLVISISVAGWFLGAEAARGQVAGELSSIVGTEAARAVEGVVASGQEPERGVLGAVFGIVTLFVGASGVFGQLQTSLDRIWEVKPKPDRGFWVMVKERFFSFTMVLGVAFLLLVSLVVSSLLSSLGTFLAAALPGGAVLWQALNFALSFGVVTLLFALIFKVIPDATVEWRDVWIGAAVTALLFTIGKLLLALYLGKAAVGSSYGAAGSIVALVVWVYYAAQILFMGAEFTQVQARHRGASIEPTPNAERISSDEPAPSSP